VLAGNPFEASVWDELRALLGETWRHASGHSLGVAMAAVDSGDGMTTAEVYSFASSKEWLLGRISGCFRAQRIGCVAVTSVTG